MTKKIYTLSVFLAITLSDVPFGPVPVSAISCSTRCLEYYNYLRSFGVSHIIAQRYRQQCMLEKNNCESVTDRPEPRTRKPYVWYHTDPPRPNTRRPFNNWDDPVTQGQPVVIPKTTPKPYRTLSSVCGIRPATRRIVGGMAARECEFPWMVSVMSIYYCGGIILDQRHILTAAHCFKSTTGVVINMSNVKVRVGSSKMAYLTTYSIANWHIHPNHSHGINDYDVAVLTLSKDLEYGPCVAPLCLANVNEEPEDPNNCYSAGWGVTSFQSRKPVQDLRKVRLPIMSPRLCLESYGSVYFNSLKLCAGDFYKGGVDTCTGDSGGPLMCERQGVWVQYGIVSFGRGCAVPYTPGVYTKISHPNIHKFILDSIQDIPG